MKGEGAQRADEGCPPLTLPPAHPHRPPSVPSVVSVVQLPTLTSVPAGKTVRHGTATATAMTTTLSTKGQIVLTPQKPPTGRPRQMRDPRTGLVVTRSPAHVKVSSEDVRAALLEFP
jgi:hypothetical protein